MDCSELERLLPAYADGEFAPGDCFETELHLERCASCREQVNQMVAFRAFIHSHGSADGPKAPASLRKGIQRKLARQRSVENLRRYASYSAVAASLVAIATAGYVSKEVHTAPRPFEVVMDAVDKHARALPVEVTPTVGDVESWFQGKVDFNVRTPTFNSPAAPRLVGARLANMGDRQAAYLVYGGDDPSHRMTLMLFPGSDLELPEESEEQVMVANEKGYNVAVWRKRGIVYSLVSDLDEGDIRQLVAEVDAR